MATLGGIPRWGAALFIFLVGAVTIPAVMDPVAAKWIVIFVACGTGAFWLAHASDLEFDGYDLVVISLVAYAGLSILWSPDPRAGAVMWPRFAAIGGLFLVARRLDGILDVMGPALAGAVIVTMVVTWLNLVGGGGFANENFQAEFLIVALPFLATRKWLIWVLAVGVVIFLATENASRIEVAAIFSLAIVGLVAIGKSGKIEAFVALGIGGLVVALLWQYGGVQESLLSRFELVVSTLAMWWASPVFGNGLGSFDYLYPGFAEVDKDILPWKTWSTLYVAKNYAGAAHNDFVQLLAELGVVGFGLAAAGLACAVPRIIEGFKEEGAKAKAAVSVLWLGTLALIGFPLQMPATAAIGAIALAGLLPVKPWRSFPRWSRPVISAPVVAISAAGLTYCWFALVGQSWFTLTHEALRAHKWEHAFVTNVAALKADPLDRRIRLQIYQSWLVANASWLPSANQEAGDHYFKISQSAIPDQPRLLMMRLAQLQHAKRCEAECEKILLTLKNTASRLTEVGRLFAPKE